MAEGLFRVVGGNTRRFGAPAAIRIEGGSYGLQIGGSSTDVFMLIMNQTGMNRLLADKFTIGGEAAGAATPVGRNTSADTDVLLHAEILTWSRSRGSSPGYRWRVRLYVPTAVRSTSCMAEICPIKKSWREMSLYRRRGGNLLLLEPLCWNEQRTSKDCPRTPKRSSSIAERAFCDGKG